MSGENSPFLVGIEAVWSALDEDIRQRRNVERVKQRARTSIRWLERSEPRTEDAALCTEVLREMFEDLLTRAGE